MCHQHSTNGIFVSLFNSKQHSYQVIGTEFANNYT